MPIDRQSAIGYAYRGVAIPLPVAKAIDAWIERGDVPRDFLQAVLRNDLREAIGRADSPAILHTIVVYLYNEAPAACSGSIEKVLAWAARFPTTRHGLERAEATIEAAAERLTDPQTCESDCHGGSPCDACPTRAAPENSVEAPEGGLLSNLPHDA